MTISYLESLSTGELIDLAGEKGLDIPGDLDRVFIIEELFYLEHEGKAAEMEDSGRTDAQFQEFVALPRQYHISFINVLIRDPLWAFVFWEIKAHDRELYEHTAGFEGYCLRVIPLDERTLQPGGSDSFMVTVGMDDNARFLGFPPEDGRCFMVELCALNHESGTVLAESRPFVLPRLIDPKHDALVQSVYRNPLAQLSGATGFSLAHSEDRLSRCWGKKE
jgi:hypothetical protein